MCCLGAIGCDNHCRWPAAEPAASGALVAQNSPPEDSAARNNQLGQELLKSLEDFRQQQNPVMPDLRLPSASAIPGESPEQQRLRSIQQRLELIRTLVQQRQEAEAAKKKTTITCVKGKITKKVTAVNPKCPSGYKKK